MACNPILEELYAAREKLLADAGGDPQKYLEGVRERERASGRLLTANELKDIRSNGSDMCETLAIESHRPLPEER